MVPSHILQQIPQKCTEGLVLALANDDDGAVMIVKWCNRSFSRMTGYTASEAVGQRGTILVGPNTDQSTHLLLIEKLMKWEHFSVAIQTIRKDGTPFRVRMTWTPVSSAEDDNRWWLCSLIEMAEQSEQPVEQIIPNAPGASPQIVAKFTEDLVRLEKENKRLHELAQTVAKESNEDALTGLSNRRHFEVELKALIADLRKGGAAFAVLYVDLDRFKSVNDTLGHDAGDALLVFVAAILRRISDKEDVIARIGGDEFVILKKLGATALNISSLADAIIQEMQNPFELDGKTVSCSASVGVAIADSKMNNPEQVVADADTALYHAKANGRGRWSFFTSEMHAEAIETKRLATELLVACESQQFVPFFQPLIEVATGRISSAETLVRWSHPERGLMPPAAFLDVADSMGILNRIDALMFASLRNAMACFDGTGIIIPKIAINVSAGRLADPNLIHDIKSSGIHPDRLTVEILESVYLERMGDVVQWALDELDELGVTLAVDDFGTGHASVQGLLNIKPAMLKIDRQFIQPMIYDDSSAALVASIVGIGKTLGMKIVAEGIETEEHARLAGEIGCDYLQGFHFGKPMSAADLRDKLIRTNGVFWPAQSTFPKRTGARGAAHSD